MGWDRIWLFQIQVFLDICFSWLTTYFSEYKVFPKTKLKTSPFPRKETSYLQCYQLQVNCLQQMMNCLNFTCHLKWISNINTISKFNKKSLNFQKWLNFLHYLLIELFNSLMNQQDHLQEVKRTLYKHYVRHLFNSFLITHMLDVIRVIK